MTNSSNTYRSKFLNKISIFIKHHSYKDDLTIACFVALLSLYYTALYFFHPHDQSWISASYPPEPIKNPIGQTGAWLSSLVYSLFGALSWALPFPLFLIIYSKLKETNTHFHYARFIFCWLGLFCSALFFAIEYQAIITLKNVPFLVSGSVGKAFHSFLIFLLGHIGGWIATITLLASSLILAFQSRLLSQTTPLVIKRFYLHLKHHLLKLKKKNKKTIIVENYNPETIAHKGEKSASSNKKQTTSKSDLYAVFSCSTNEKTKNNQKEINHNKAIIEETLKQFGVLGKIINHHQGPVITIYEFQPEVGIKQSKLTNLVDDLALSLKVDSVFINPVKGERALGIQIPNKKPDVVFLGDLIQSTAFKMTTSPLTLTLGIADSGEIVCENLATMPHLLIAGATGTGKSVNINALICSLIIKLSAKDIRLIMIDPKVLELSIYNGIPHLLVPVITESKKANHALHWAIYEMERRYEMMQSFNVRNIESYNDMIQNSTKDSKSQSNLADLQPFPYIIIVIDELADLMLTSSKETESLIQRLSQKARASGIHMILATQRPSVDVITGVIKANLPCRISFQAASRHDSRTILDQIGSEKLLGKGDMFFLKPGQQRFKRIQGPYISDNEIIHLVKLLKIDGPQYNQDIIDWIEKKNNATEVSTLDTSLIQIEEDSKYKEALEISRTNGVVSASFLQRHLQIGYNRASRMIDHMEKNKLISKADGSKPRKWLAKQT